MSFTAIKLLAFDLDGTLLDSVPDLATATNQTMEAIGYPQVTESQVRDWVGNGADALLARAINGNMDTSLEDAELAQQAKAFFTVFYQQTQHRYSVLYPQVKASLTRLQEAGYKMALVTNKPSQFIPAILQQHQLDVFFDDIFGGDCVANKKPHPEALLTLLQKHQLTAAEMIMVGDSKNDILAAKNAGCASFGLTYGYNHGEPIANACPDVVADGLDELVELLLA